MGISWGFQSSVVWVGSSPRNGYAVVRCAAALNDEVQSHLQVAGYITSGSSIWHPIRGVDSTFSRSHMIDSLERTLW